MWKVTNKSNERALFLYNRKVILVFWDFWRMMARKRKIGEKLLVANFLEDSLDTSNIDKRFLSATINGKTSFRTLTIQIIGLGTSKLNKEFKLFFDQNRKVAKFDYNFDFVKHPNCLTQLFKNYFYDLFWGKTWIWNEIVGLPFDRSAFQEKFKIDNKLSICPYCDLTTIPSRRSAWIEHFLPKDNFPYVSNNPRNLIPCCTPCNVAGTGKGTGSRNPVTSPLKQQIGDELEFRLVEGRIQISEHANPEVESYLSLLKSRERYREANVQRSIFRTLKLTYELIIQVPEDEQQQKVFLSYIKDMGRETGHYFVRKTLLNDIGLINNLD